MNNKLFLEILNDLTLKYPHLNIYSYGSVVYNTFSEKSDFDFILTGDCDNQSLQEFYGDQKTDLHFFNIELFKSKIYNHEVSAIECIFLPLELKYEPIKIDYELNLTKIREQFSATASNSWVKSKKKIIDGELYIAQKSLFHSFRILNFACQLADNKSINFNSLELWQEIQRIPITLDAYHLQKEKYNYLKSELRKKIKI